MKILKSRQWVYREPLTSDMVLIKPFIWDKIGFDSNSDWYYNKYELEEIMTNKKFTEQEMLTLRNSKYHFDVSTQQTNIK